MLNKKQTSRVGLSNHVLFLSLFAALLLTAYACKGSNQSKPGDAGIANENGTQTNNTQKSIMLGSVEEKEAAAIEYVTSNYDDLGYKGNLSKQRESLKMLSDKNVFSTVHAKLMQTLAEKHQIFFASKPDYELLSFAKGDLFLEGKNDCAFIVYDKKKQQISIVIYNEKTNKYSELYRDLKVENGLKDADCKFGGLGSLDCNLAYEITYHKNELLNKPEELLNYTFCKIVNLSEDKDFVLDRGCFSKKVSNDNVSNSLCISASFVYNNWECLKYDKATDAFIIFYGQAFAD